MNSPRETGSVHSSAFSSVRAQPQQIKTLTTATMPQGLSQQRTGSSSALVAAAAQQQAGGWPSDRVTLPEGVPLTAPVEHRVSGMGYNLPDNAYQTETRKISSVVIESTPLHGAPQEREVRYVDVPTVEEQVTYVTVKEVREIEKRVPKFEVEYVERVVEVPKIQYVDVVREVEEVKWIDVPCTAAPKERVVERIVEKKVPMKRVKEEIKEVPGPVIEVAKPYNVERRVEVVRHVDREVPVVVAQTVKPVIAEGDTNVSVDVLDYEPEVVPVDVHVAKPVGSTLEVVGHVGSRHKLVNITSGQYNTILKILNQHMNEKSRATLPFVSENGRVPFIADKEANFIVAPPDVEIEGWSRPMPTRAPSHQTRARDASVYETVSAQGPADHPTNARCCGGSKRTKHNAPPVVTTTSDVGSMRGGDYTQTHDQASHHVHHSSHQHHIHHDTGSVHTDNASALLAGSAQTNKTRSVIENGSVAELSQRPQNRRTICC